MKTPNVCLTSTSLRVTQHEGHEPLQRCSGLLTSNEREAARMLFNKLDMPGGRSVEHLLQS